MMNYLWAVLLSLGWGAAGVFLVIESHPWFGLLCILVGASTQYYEGVQNRRVIETP